jgi:hypothetical protein
MITVSPSAPAVTDIAKSYTSIDAQAEREAAALEFFAEELGQRQPMDPLRVRREESHAAATLGLAPVKHHRYGRKAAAIAWIAVLDAIKAGKTPKIQTYLDTRADRARRLVRRVDRAARAIALAQLADEHPPISKQQAVELSGFSSRVIDRRLADGSLPAIRLGRSAAAQSGVGLLIEVKDLARLLARKCAPAA